MSEQSKYWTCPACNRYVADHFDHCPQCGRYHPEAQVIRPAPSGPAILSYPKASDFSGGRVEPMKPELGRIVRYILTDDDCAAINRRRTNGSDIAARIRSEKWPIGAQAHIGEMVFPGDERPAMVVQVFIDGATGRDLVNLQVGLDGTDIYWARNVSQCAIASGAPGYWHWPVRS